MAFAPACFFGRPPEQRNSKRSVSWFVHCYLHGRGDDDVLPVSGDVLDGIRVGGARNYGFGELSLTDSLVVDLDALDYGRLTDAESGAYVLELVSPYVLSSAYPDADDQSVPWWWDASSATESPTIQAGRVSGTVATDGRRDDGLRRRDTRLVDGGDAYRVETVDHGQVVGYAGVSPWRRRGTAWCGSGRIRGSGSVSSVSGRLVMIECLAGQLETQRQLGWSVMALEMVPFDIETTGFDVTDEVTVVGLELSLGCRVFLQADEDALDGDLAALEATVGERCGTHVKLSLHASEAALLAAVGVFARERLHGEDVLLVAFNGERWKDGFDLPFCGRDWRRRT